MVQHQLPHIVPKFENNRSEIGWSQEIFDEYQEAKELGITVQ